MFAASPEVLAERGTQALRQSRFKEATDLFKQLIRQDPRPEWTQRLGDAYAGRARALAEKSMFKEAAIVLENTLSSDGMVREPLLYLTCLIRQGQHQKARRVALDSVARLPVAEAAQLAEIAAVLSLAVPAPTGVPQAGPPDGAALAAQAALHAWLQNSPAEEVDRLLSRIPLRSPFGPVRLILKGLITPPDAAGKARGLLAMIPASSGFATTRDAAEAALAEDQAALLDRWTRLRPAQQQFVGETRGLPQGTTALLNQILDAERRGPAALFSLLTRRGLPLPADELRTACLNLLPAIPDRLSQFEQQFGPVSTLERNRILALAAEASEDWYRAWRYWDAAVATLSTETTPEARLAQAVVLRHLADLARTHQDLCDNVEKPGEDAVATYLERSIEADPDYLPATLTLLDRYRTADSPKDWHRAADAAAERFPGNTTVLLHAVDAAVARSAYKKAVGFARRLLTVDPINLPVRQRMIDLQLAHARKQMRSGRTDLANKALAEAAEWERPDTPNAALRIGRALVTMTADQANATQDALRAAVQEAGGGTVGWFRAVLEASLMGWPEKRLQPLGRELDTAQQGEPTRETILALVSLLGQKEIRDGRRAIAPALRRIDPFLAKGSRIAWLPAEFQTIAELLAHLHEFPTLHRYAQAALRRDADNQAAQFYQILARAEGKRDHLSEVQESELFNMLEETGKRQDFHLFNRVQRLLFGPGMTRARRGKPMDEPPMEALDEADMAELLAALADGMPGLPAKEVRSMLNEFGRDMAIDMLAATVASSPMADVFSEEQVTQLCAALIDQALQARPQKARRR